MSEVTNYTLVVDQFNLEIEDNDIVALLRQMADSLERRGIKEIETLDFYMTDVHYGLSVYVQRFQ